MFFFTTITKVGSWSSDKFFKPFQNNLHVKNDFVPGFLSTFLRFVIYDLLYSLEYDFFASDLSCYNSIILCSDWKLRIPLAVQGPPWQSVYFGVKILSRKKVLRIIYPMDFLFPEKHISFAKTSFSRFWHFRKKVSWFQLFFDIFSKKFLPSGI